MYFKLGGGGATGWSDAQWNTAVENDEPGLRYMVEDPETPQHTQRLIVTDSEAIEHRLFFMTAQDEEDLFDLPGGDS